MSPPLEYHISTLLKSLIDELIARFCGLARLPATGQEDSTFFIFHGHEVGRYLYVHDVRTVRMRTEIVHEQVVRVVDEEMKCVDHFPVVAY